MDKGLFIFVEGKTDYEFFSNFRDYLRTKIPGNKFKFNFLEIKNLKGIGRYKGKAKAFCGRKIQGLKNKTELTVFLCYDTDVFDSHENDPIDWNEVESELKSIGIENVYHIKIKKSIEDWLLKDEVNLKKFLRIAQSTKIKGNNGVEKIKYIFKKASKVYVKGEKVNGLIDNLDIKVIGCSNCKDLKPLCEMLNVNCDQKTT